MTRLATRRGTHQDLALGKVVAAVLQGIPASGHVVLGVAAVTDVGDQSGLALALARLLSRHLAQTVLVMETDLGHPSRLAAAFGLPSRPTLSDLIASPEAASRPVGHRVEPGLLVVPCGSDAPDLRVVPDRPLAALLAQIAVHTPTTVLLCPPLSDSRDGMVVASACDRLVLVVDQGATSRVSLAEVVEDLGPERFVGAIMVSESAR